jgi:hypothetical protein
VLRVAYFFVDNLRHKKIKILHIITGNLALFFIDFLAVTS